MKDLYNRYLNSTGVCTDTRQIQDGNIFFALKGSNFNGNQYAMQALESGASLAVIDEPIFPNDPRLILVNNSLKTLQDLSGYHRSTFHIPFLAITGSNGKTTTKELIHAVLSTHLSTYTTEGNLNNHIGIPLTLLKIKEDAEVAIIEMGANHQKEIAGYCSYTRPTHGLITNCGKAHLEGFGSLEGVRKGKGELFDFLRTQKGTAFINQDYDYLIDMSHDIPAIVKYGTTGGDIVGLIIEKNNDGFLRLRITNGAHLPSIHTQLVGDYNLPNVLAAVAVGKYFGVSDDKIKNALESYKPSNSRSQLIEKRGARIILDAYNANPSSMRAAILNFEKMPGNNKIILIGAMKEMGTESKAEHSALTNLIKNYHWKTVALVGAEFEDIPSGFLHFNDVEQAREWFSTQDIHDTQILIKGSRGVKMEKLLDGF